MVNRDTMLEAECKHMPHSTERFGKVVKQASAAEQQGTRGCKKQTKLASSPNEGSRKTHDLLLAKLFLKNQPKTKANLNHN